MESYLSCLAIAPLAIAATLLIVTLYLLHCDARKTSQNRFWHGPIPTPPVVSRADGFEVMPSDASSHDREATCRQGPSPYRALPTPFVSSPHRTALPAGYTTSTAHPAGHMS